MDKQLVEEFDNKYFGKNQLRRRIYEESEMEKIWKEISENRKKTSINIKIDMSDKSENWYNVTEDMKLVIEYIDNIEKSEIINYLSDNNVMSYFQGNNEKLLGVSSIERFYVDTYRENDFEKSKEILVKLLGIIDMDKECNVLIKAAIIHFYIIHLKPFTSNNLDMAEYISNIFLVENGYKIIKYCNILDFIKADKRRYYNSLENSIVNDGDITYFIKYYVSVIQIAIKELTKEITITKGKKIIKELLERHNTCLEDRQIKFINSMVNLNADKVSIDDYKRKSKISYETARSDLNELVAIGFFKISKSGKKYEYYFNDISTIIENLNDMSMILKY